MATNTKDIKINIDVVDNNTKQALRNLLTEVNSALKTAAPTGNPAFNNYIKNLKKTVADFRVELTAAFKDIEKMKLNPPMSPQKSTTRIKNMEGGFRDVTSYTMGVDSSKFDPLIKKVNSLSSSIKELVDTVKKIGQIPNESLSGLTKGLDKSLRKPTRSLVEEYKKMGKQQVDAIIRNNELERQAYANSPEGTFNKKVQSIQDGINKSKTMLKLYHDWLKTDGVNASKEVKIAMADFGRELERMSQGVPKGVLSLRHLGNNFRLIKADIKDLIGWQARWYGTRLLWSLPMELFADSIKKAWEHTKLIDEIRADLLKWEATSGKLADSVKVDTQEMINSMRYLTTQYPIALKDLATSAESFISAGVSGDVVKELLPTLAQLGTSFPKINMSEFGTAIVGFMNSFTGSIEGAKSKADEIRIIIEQLIYAQAKGVIKPEQFTQVIQHLGEVGRMAGFSTGEIIALSVAVTDLGSKTGNASRSLRQMLQSLVMPKNKKILAQLGIEIDPKQDLATQFIPIMKKLRETLGQGPGKASLAQAVLGEIFTVSSIKSANALIDFLEKVETLSKNIGNASKSGGLELAANLKTQTLEGELKRLDNIWKEFITGTMEAGGAFKFLVSILNDALLGAISAVGSEAVKAQIKFNDLGVAGKTVAEVFNNMLIPFKLIGEAFSALSSKEASENMEKISYSASLAKDALSSLSTIIEIIITLLSVKLGGAVLKKIGTWLGLGKVIKDVGKTGAEVLPKIAEGAGKAGEAIETATGATGRFGEALGGLGKAFAASGLIALLLYTAKLVHDIEKGVFVERDIADFKKKTETMSEEGRKKWLSEMEGEDKSLYGGGEGEPENVRRTYQRRLEILRNSLGLGTLGDMPSVSEVTPAEKKAGTATPDVLDKKKGGEGRKYDYNAELADVRKKYDEELKKLKDAEKNKIDEQEMLYKEDELTYEEYINNKTNIAIEANKKEKDLLLQKKAEEEAFYSTNRAKATGDAIKAIDEDHKNQQLEIQRKLQQIDTDTDHKNRARIVDIYKYRRDQEAAFVKWSIDEAKKQLEAQTALFDKVADRQSAAMQFLYDRGILSATKMREYEINSANDVYANRLRLIEQEESTLESRANAEHPGGDFADLEAYSRAVESGYRELNTKRLENEQDLYRKLEDITRKFALNAEYIFETSGPIAAMREGLQQVANDYSKFGQQWVDLSKGIAGDMAAAFDTFFFGVISGELKNNKDMLKSFSDSISKTASGFLSKQVMGYFSGIFKDIGPASTESKQSILITQTNNILNQILLAIQSQSPSWGVAPSATDFGVSPEQEDIDFMNNITDDAQQASTVVESTMSKMLSSVGSTFGELGSLISSALSSIMNSVLGSFHSGGYIPRFHLGGVNSDERIGILQTGEGILSRRGVAALGSLNSGNSLSAQPPVFQLNVENSTGQPVQMEQKGQPSWDGEKYVLSVIMKNYNSYGSMYQMVHSKR